MISGLQHRLICLFVAQIVISRLAFLHVLPSQPAPAKTARAAALAAIKLCACMILLPDPVAEPLLTTVTTFLVGWLGVFKTLALALNRGPLHDPGLSFPQFLAIEALPILPAPPRDRRTPPPITTSLPIRAAIKLALLAAVVQMLTRHPDLPPILLHVIYVAGLYSFLGVLMDISGALLERTLFRGRGLEPHFRAPWRARSIGDFWGSRWNLAAGGALRMLVFDPVVEGSWIQAPERMGRKAGAGRRFVGVAAAFVASGIAHELILWKVAGRPDGRWLLFFAMQAPLGCIDRAAYRGVLAGCGRVVRFLITGALLEGGAYFYFFPPVVESGVANRVVKACAQSFSSGWAAMTPS